MIQQEIPVRFWPIMIAVFFGSFLTTLSSGTLNIALPALMQHFQENLDVVQWTLTGFMLAMGTASPLAGFLGDRFSTKRVYAASLLGFVAASALCAGSWSISSFIAFRVLQGAFCGLIIPTTMAIIYQVIPRERQVMAISYWAMATMLAPAIGPTLAGFLMEHFQWRALFLVNLPLGLLGVLIIFRFVPFYKLTSSKSFDGFGLVASTVGSVALLMAFSQGAKWGWLSGPTLSLLLLGILMLTVFIWHAAKTPEPLLNVRVFRYKMYVISIIVSSILTVALYAGVLLAPLFLQNVQSISPLNTGLIILPSTLTMAAIMPLVGRLSNRLDPRWLVVPGLLFITISSWMLGHLRTDTPHAYLVFWMTFRYVGVALAMTPASNVGMMAVPRALVGHASAMSNWVRQGLGALSIGLFSALITYRSGIHAIALANKGTVPEEMLAQTALTSGLNDVFLISTAVAIVAVVASFWLAQRTDEAPT